MEAFALVLLIGYAITSAVVYYCKGRTSGKSVGGGIGLAIVGVVLFANLWFGTLWILDSVWQPHWLYRWLVHSGDEAVSITVMTAALFANCAIAAMLLSRDPHACTRRCAVCKQTAIEADMIIDEYIGDYVHTECHRKNCPPDVEQAESTVPSEAAPSAPPEVR